MARFYGWEPRVIENMDTETFQTYRLAMAPLKSAELLDAVSAVCYPHKTEDNQKKFYKSVNKPLDPFKKKKDLSEIDIFKMGGV